MRIEHQTLDWLRASLPRIDVKALNRRDNPC